MRAVLLRIIEGGVFGLIGRHSKAAFQLLLPCAYVQQVGFFRVANTQIAMLDGIDHQLAEALIEGGGIRNMRGDER